MSKEINKPACPKCKSKDTLVIIYGLIVPEEAAMNLKNEGGYWGGCVIPDKPKKWHCDSCRYEWGQSKYS